ncbi:hypothetical protein GRJ2_002473500 [Grus japonensis]|uniref:Uncharacterized protein n=1 Tax=Grus japonensis TaxID=30415 RepID=A0ABC9XQZ7_GRUJA
MRRIKVHSSQRFGELESALLESVAAVRQGTETELCFLFTRAIWAYLHTRGLIPCCQLRKKRGFVPKNLTIRSKRQDVCCDRVHFKDYRTGKEFGERDVTVDFQKSWRLVGTDHSM